MKYIKIWIAFCLLFACFSPKVKAQNANEVTVKSTVYDDKGRPVTGAAVSGNEGKKITYTDATGQFSITVSAGSVVLINARGFKTQTLSALAIPETVTLVPGDAAMEVNLPFKKI